MAKISRYVERSDGEQVKWWLWKRSKKRARARRTETESKTGRPWSWFAAQPRKFRYLLRYHYERCQIGDIDGEFLQYLLDAQERRCCYCECELTFDNRILEHHRPIYRGGKNTRDNVSWACWDCNTKKGTQTYDEFMAATGRADAPGVAAAWSHQGEPDQSSSAVRRAEARSAGAPQPSQVAACSERADSTLRPDGDGAAPARE